ncbi:BglG family transcription antiterminator [Nesterenkonia sphaerica]|uniref:PRD domain-containing protein n=1 Tax=Nesterenkonia sphaerica TaxID=1804988 RepID=A0A5R9AEE7_9MICC|nr:PTS sugar transporter subunit IIA [Nesterenkonia sphaerica]TLP77152.1 PRD domain-containing protein [Nesterenkonia sphaerica]
MRRRPEQVASLLLRAEGWVTAASLADSLGVTPRSVRSYISQLNARSAPRTAVESGPQGYRAERAVLARLRAESESATPQDRVHTLVRELLGADAGVDIHRTASLRHVSEATVESDVARVRDLIAGSGLKLQRSGSRVMLVGDELAQRRLVSQLAHQEMDAGFADIASLRRTVGLKSIDPGAFSPFKQDLTTGLGEQGYYVNELAVSDVILHVAIAADRVTQGRALTGSHVDPTPAQQRVAELLDELTLRHFGTRVGLGDVHHLASLILTRAVIPKGEDLEVGLDPHIESVVRRAVQHAAEEYLVDIYHDDFLRRLSLHVQNLVHRAKEQAWSRNPLTRSLKAAYPMVFEVAVSIASEVGHHLQLSIGDDEIAYIAMHVGGRLERNRRSETVLTATIVCPGYYELHELLRSRIDRSLGASVEVTAVETEMSPDWGALTTDLVLTTVEPPVPDERTVLLPPFLTEADTERIAAAAARRRRARRLARLRAELEHYFDPHAFVRPLQAMSEPEVIRALGAPLIELGVIDADYIDRAIAREAMSSTAFTDALAVPHALKMTAGRTALSVGVAESSLRWGENRVQFVVLVAFSEEDREAFQTIFEQLVEVFNERDSVQRLLRRGTNFTDFLDELTALIDG